MFPLPEWVLAPARPGPDDAPSAAEMDAFYAAMPPAPPPSDTDLADMAARDGPPETPF